MTSGQIKILKTKIMFLERINKTLVNRDKGGYLKDAAKKIDSAIFDIEQEIRWLSSD